MTKKPTRVFVVIIVSQGMQAPYFTVNRPIIWIRTGDISSQVKQSDRTALLELVERGKRFKGNFDIQIHNAEEIFRHRYIREIKEYNKDYSRSRGIKKEEVVNDKQKVMTSIMPISSDVLVNHKDLYKRRQNLFNDCGFSATLESTRYGLVTTDISSFCFSSESNEDTISYLYLNEYGFMYFVNEAMHWSGVNDFDRFSLHLMRNIINAVEFYKQINYCGMLCLHIKLVLDGSARLCYSLCRDFKNKYIDIDTFFWIKNISTYDLVTEEGRKRIIKELFETITLDLGIYEGDISNWVDGKIR